MAKTKLKKRELTFIIVGVSVVALAILVLSYSVAAPRLEPLVNLTLGLSQLVFFTPVGVIALLAAGTLLGGLGGWLARAGREL